MMELKDNASIKQTFFNYFDQFWPVFVSIPFEFKMVNPSNEKTNVYLMI